LHKTGRREAKTIDINSLTGLLAKQVIQHLWHHVSQILTFTFYLIYTAIFITLPDKFNIIRCQRCKTLLSLHLNFVILECRNFSAANSVLEKVSDKSE